MKPELENTDIDTLLSDRNAFNRFVYTPLNKALDELNSRENDKDIDEYVKGLLHAGIPKIFEKKKYAFLSRSIVTPNYEVRRFLSIVDAIGTLTPLFWEYSNDKFVPNGNKAKHHLAKLHLYIGKGKNGGEKIKKFDLINFNTESGKKLCDVQTHTGESLVDFHKKFLLETCKQSKNAEFFDASDWYVDIGGGVTKYYKHILALFLKNGILFEDFIIEDKYEQPFIREVFLPAFIEIYKELGRKPLIVALEPTEMETREFWMYYPHSSVDFLESKLENKLL